MKTIPKLLECIEPDKNNFFRGHADKSWQLLPSIGRYFSQAWSQVKEREKSSLEEFKRRSLPYLQLTPKSDIEWLCLMQHHGCPTRLLDFTTNPLIALFFAADPTVEADGELVIVRYGRPFENVVDKDLFDRSNAFVYHPPHITTRIIGQSGCFVFSPNPNEPLRKRKKRVAITKNLKTAVRRELSMLGISHSSLFPGVDGVCQDLRDALVSDLEFEEIFS